MLSKVISGRAATSATAVVFPVLHGASHPRADRGTDAGDEERRTEFRETVLRMEREQLAACREAREAGLQQGLQQAHAELQPVIERMNAALSDLVGLRSDLRGRAEKDVVRLSLMIAKRVLHRELTVDEGALTAIARVAFERLTRSESYEVTVHPRFAAAITAALPASQMARVRIECDVTCSPGTLVIRSPEGIIDASVDAQLDEITRGLTDRIAVSS